MSPDTLPAPCPKRRDTQALRPPPPPLLIPSHPTRLRGRCHSVVKIPEPELLVRGGDDGEVETTTRGDERRGISITSGSPGAFPYFPLSPLLYPSDNSLQKLGQGSSTFYQQCVLNKNRRSEEQKHFVQTDQNSSASPCVELSDILSMI